MGVMRPNDGMSMKEAMKGRSGPSWADFDLLLHFGGKWVSRHANERRLSFIRVGRQRR